ncbi:DUF1576 domain-containing protein [Xylanimonas ulmi]|uniref:Uncharacterized protein DUF1576 n=1 Tax=Xylanimonas ulmi TaxID=228973 RepID=A0A4Q7M1X3_9MICO|nr:DUF1576 domain-containing protein [Xylanibacterium ulmi]RZS60953.1 uncharacterized protein DUF1576 [Xylanibacterium ulmi]
MALTALATTFGQRLRDDVETDLQRVKFRLLVGLCVGAMLLGVLVDTPAELAHGTIAILSSPSGLLTDYMAIASVGATFFNAGLLTLLSVIVVRRGGTEFSGPVIAGLFTVFGFALFGKNLFNSIPITLGVYLYARLERKRFSDYQVESLFGTALGPAVSFMAFGKGLPLWQGILLGWVIGVFVGVVIPPMSRHFAKFHHGLSLYNVGFTAGIVGMVIVAVMNLLEYDVVEVYQVSSGYTVELAVATLTFCVALLVCGFLLNGRSVRGMAAFMRRSGQAPSDFVALEGIGRTVMNMGLMGILATTYVLVVGGDLNGPVLGGVFTVIGFGAYGKHPRNCVPILVGVALATAFTTADIDSTHVLLAALFGTTLAPVSGVFGSLYGVVAGFLHMALVANVGLLHGGLNLYNNGFSAGFVAFLLFPLFNAKLRIRGKGVKGVKAADPEHTCPVVAGPTPPPRG